MDELVLPGDQHISSALRRELLATLSPQSALAVVRGRCELRHRDLFERYYVNALARESLWQDFTERRARQRAANKLYLAGRRRR